MFTKAQMIMDLHAKGKTTRQIALAIYGPMAGKVLQTKMAYVRVVCRQRGGSGRSDTDRKYLDGGGRARAAARINVRYRTDPEFRALALARTATWQRSNRAKRAASQRAYRQRKLALAGSANQMY